MKTKHCNDCNTTKPLAAFGVRKDRASGRTPYCRECNRLRWREWSERKPA